MNAPSGAFGLFLLAGLTAFPLAAQSVPDSRTSVPLPPLVGSALMAVGGAVWPSAGATYAADALLAFQSVERNRGKGALWGATLGLVAGGLLAGLTASSEEDDGFGGGGLAESAATVEGVVFGALLGAGLGAILGATVFAPSRSRGSAGGGNLAVHVAPRPRAEDGVGVGLRWRR
jgi:hypothetical protein